MSSSSDYGADCNEDSHVFEASVQGLLVGSLNGVGFFVDGSKVVRLSFVKHARNCVSHLLHLGNRFIQILMSLSLIHISKYAALYNVVDSFDTHAKIPTHFAKVDEAAKGAGKTALISCGWDPGLFSLNRLSANCILPEGADYTFWGRGVSQGHSDALRRIPGVADARQYTIPVPEALEAVRSGSNPELTTREKHTRECWVVLEEGADPAEVTKQIVEMPNYFDEYDVTVNFISQEELDRDHAGLPHGGMVIRTGKTAGDKNCKIEYSLDLESNPEFTACVLACYCLLYTSRCV